MNQSGSGVIGLLIAVAVYAYICYCLQRLAEKNNVKHAWLAWIPIAQAFIWLETGGKPLWWFILLLIPLVNLVIGIIVWMRIAEAMHKPGWLGVLIIVPLVNFIVIGYLVFSENTPPTITPPAQTAV